MYNNFQDAHRFLTSPCPLHKPELDLYWDDVTRTYMRGSKVKRMAIAATLLSLSLYIQPAITLYVGLTSTIYNFPILTVILLIIQFRISTWLLGIIARLKDSKHNQLNLPRYHQLGKLYQENPTFKTWGIPWRFLMLEI
jgi:hypothetical protein